MWHRASAKLTGDHIRSADLHCNTMLRSKQTNLSSITTKSTEDGSVAENEALNEIHYDEAMCVGDDAPVRPCFLCVFAAEPRVVEYANFIVKESVRAGVHEIATQICADIHAEHGPEVPDITVGDIEKHIEHHMLHPTVKLSAMLKELDWVRRVLHRSVYRADGATIGSANNVKLYLQVVAAQQNLYKLGDTNRLAFGNHPANPSDKPASDASQ
jgi:hypothetical protein